MYQIQPTKLKKILLVTTKFFKSRNTKGKKTKTSCCWNRTYFLKSFHYFLMCLTLSHPFLHESPTIFTPFLKKVFKSLALSLTWCSKFPIYWEPNPQNPKQKRRKKQRKTEDFQDFVLGLYKLCNLRFYLRLVENVGSNSSVHTWQWFIGSLLLWDLYFPLTATVNWGDKLWWTCKGVDWLFFLFSFLGFLFSFFVKSWDKGNGPSHYRLEVCRLVTKSGNSS